MIKNCRTLSFCVFGLILSLISGCSKSITAIGTYEGVWEGTIYWSVCSRHDHPGRITLEVTDDSSFSGTGYLDWIGNIGTGVSIVITVSGEIFPNGAVDADCKWSTYIEGNMACGTSEMKGGFNPAEDAGKGSVNIDGTVLDWYVFRTSDDVIEK